MRARAFIASVLIVALSACGTGASNSSSTKSATQKNAPIPTVNEGADSLIEIEIMESGVKPSGETKDLTVGTKVAVEVQAAHDDVVHIHGFEKEIPVKKGARASAIFTADKVGRYEIETHNPALKVLTLNIRPK